MTGEGGPEVLLVQNAPSSGSGRLLDWLREAGLQPRVVSAHEGEPLPTGTAGLGGLVLLGGGLLPTDDERAPWLAAERTLLGEAVRSQTPVLGICLGAQLLAHCTGGIVTGRSGETERGSCAVRLLGPAASDPVFGAVAGDEELRMIQNHRDSITTAPPEAVLLASSDVCAVQAFRIGETAWGVQFHPEVDASRLESWNESALAAQGYDRAEMVARAHADGPVNRRQARALVDAFAAVVAQRHRHTQQTPQEARRR